MSPAAGKPSPPSRPPQEPEFDVREAVEAGEALQGHLATLEDQMGYLGALVNEFSRAKVALEALEGLKPGEEMLLSIGGGNFVRANLADKDRVVSGIGSGYSVEGPVQDAVARAEAQVAAAREAIQRLQEEAQRTLAQMQALEERLSQLQG
jgi:prefoldin alpha subunit